MGRFMRRFAMAVNAVGMAAAALAFAWTRGEPGAWALAWALALWAAAELQIGLFRSYQGVVPRDRLVAAARGAWLLAAIYAWLDAWHGWTRLTLPTPAVLGATALLAGGALLRGWAVAALGPSFSYDVKRPAGGLIVQTGPYRWIRHPAYLGLCLASIAPGLALGSVVGFLGLLAATLVATLGRLVAEERLLAAELGEPWRAYAARTWRLLPFVY
jgi:protein-S-isoprenylcysteine O-methyltransferase